MHQLSKMPLAGITISLITFVSLAWSSEAQEPKVAAEVMPRLPHTEPDAALSTFEVAEGFTMELVAHEPAIVDPIAISFDEKGRAYVVEMRGYSERREESLGRIRLLTDTDGDGVFDESVVYKDGLKWPTAVIPYKGGIFVGATPDIYYFRDTDGDNVADEEKVVFTGFADGQYRLNMQGLFNSFRWGPDNRIWGAASTMGGNVTRPDDPSFKPVSVRGADFSFDPEALDLRAENGYAQNGMCFDEKGSRYACRNSRHAIWIAYERGQVKPNPFYNPPPAPIDIPEDGNFCKVYRISPDEPWRIARTKLRLAGLVKGSAEAGGRVSGFFTAATGIHSFWSSGLGSDAYSNIFVGDVGSNLVHRMVLESQEGQVAPVAARYAKEEKSEFIRSSDNWFRPTSFATGPDGALYIADMYREVIEHPWSLPDNIKTHLDLNSGWKRGRIYRVTAEGAPLQTVRDLSKASEEELQKFAASPNDWQQTTARRLLYEMGKPLAPKPAPGPFPANLSSEKPLLDSVALAMDDSWMRAAVLNSLRDPASAKQAWEKASSFPLGAFHADFAELCGKMGDPDLITSVVARLTEGEISTGLVDTLSRLSSGINQAKGDWNALRTDKQWANLLERSRALVDDESADTANQIAAIRIVRTLYGEGTFDWLKEKFEATKNPQIQEALAAAITDLPWLVERFGKLSETAKSQVSNRILSSPKAAQIVLDKIEGGAMALDMAPAALVQGLRKHKNAAVAKRADAVLPKVVTRESVVKKYIDAGVLEAAGDREKGKAVFMRACFTCHISHEGEGIELGPGIATFATAGRDSLLTNILHPNKEVAAQYQAYQITQQDGTTLIGMIKSETQTEVTLRMPGGVDRTFPRETVAEMKGFGQSLMPDGLESAVPVADMADLLTYLLSAE